MYSFQLSLGSKFKIDEFLKCKIFPRRYRSPYHKRSYIKTSPQKRVEKKIEDKKEEKIEDKKKEEENLYQPPTPEENVVAADTEPENGICTF